MCRTNITVTVESEAGNSTNVEIEAKNTYLSIYGSGWLQPALKGYKYDAGDSFQFVAEARNNINKREHAEDIHIISYCPTDVDFFEIINRQVNIKRLDIYCHGYAHGLNLGGFIGKRTINGLEKDSSELDWDTRTPDGGRDLRLVDIHENLYLGGTEKNELTKMDANVFTNDVEVYFWGCNIGGQLSPSGEHVLDNRAGLKDPKGSFAQKFAEQIGKGNVYALVGKGTEGGSLFKQDVNGKNYYDDGEMLPANIAANAGYKNTKQLNAIDYMKKFPL